jgi:hypothetical protein
MLEGAHRGRDSALAGHGLMTGLAGRLVVRFS